jgi:RNA polymerase sigma factor (sigma-70 family)
MHSVTDEELMLQVRNGAGETLGVLFDRYQAPLFSFYCKLTGDRSLSEDLVQEVFLRILKYRQSYQPGTPFRAWIYQIARNARIDHFRKARPQTELEPEMLPSVRPTDSAQEQQEAALLHTALMRLPEEKREVLILSRFQELKCEEIARLVGTEITTVRVRIHRALQELRQIFRQLERAPAESRSGTGVTGRIPPRRLGHEV